MGLNLYFKVENPFGQRIQELFVRGERVRPDRVYETAFVTSQGVPDKYGSQRQELDIRAVGTLRRYLEESGSEPVEAPLRGSIIAV